MLRFYRLAIDGHAPARIGSLCQHDETRPGGLAFYPHLTGHIARDPHLPRRGDYRTTGRVFDNYR